MGICAALGMKLKLSWNVNQFVDEISVVVNSAEKLKILLSEFENVCERIKLNINVRGSNAEERSKGDR